MCSYSYAGCAFEILCCCTPSEGTGNTYRNYSWRKQTTRMRCSSMFSVTTSRNVRGGSHDRRAVQSIVVYGYAELIVKTGRILWWIREGSGASTLKQAAPAERARTRTFACSSGHIGVQVVRERTRRASRWDQHTIHAPWPPRNANILASVQFTCKHTLTSGDGLYS